jgi:nickel/cobalt transporter (NicO) family protein
LVGEALTAINLSKVMDRTYFVPIATTGFAVALLHAAIPTHWLPFALAARGRGWSHAKTLGIAALAALGHTAFTTLLGVLVVVFGYEVSRWTGDVFPWIAGGIVALVGLYFLIWRGIGHHHTESKAPTGRSDKAVILGLLALLTFSPCEGFLPVYLSGVGAGWGGFIFLTVILGTATMAAMVFFTWLALSGIAKLNLHALEHFEGAILGGLLILLGIAIVWLEQ